VFEKKVLPKPPPPAVGTAGAVPSPAPGRWFQDHCVVEGAVLLIDNLGDIMPQGRAVPGGHPRCAFDIIGPNKTYCVNREDGEVLLEDDRDCTASAIAESARTSAAVTDAIAEIVKTRSRRGQASFCRATPRGGTPRCLPADR
jgi:hypothetical protein